jgi:Trk K+ transport system NAD-binding subunit
MRGHLILCRHDTLTPGLVMRLNDARIPYVVLEPDRARAAELSADGVRVVSGDVDSPDTYRALRAAHAAFVLANREDTVNTNITLTVREVAPDVPIIALVSADEAEDVLQLAGATHVLPLSRQLGEHLANRVNTSHAHTHVIGRYRDLRLAELPVRNTPFSGKTLREARLREISGTSVIGVWTRGRFHAAEPDRTLTDACMPVVVGTQAQLEALDELMLIYNVNTHPVLIIGGGRVGRAAARSLLARGTAVHVVERDPVIAERARRVGATVFEGDAADYALLDQAGIGEAPSVLLTTHDDAMNIFLAAYCRRLNPAIRIVSRITHDRNMESIHRAGADFVLSYAALGVSAVFSLLQGKDLVVLGEGLDLYTVRVPRDLAGRTLAESGIGARSGLVVVGVHDGGEMVSNPPPGTVLPAGGELAMLGTPEQRHRFVEAFE